MTQDNISVINEQEKLQILEEIETGSRSDDESLSILDVFSNDNDNFIRANVAKILVNFADVEKGERILFDLLTDKDSLIRAEAADSLSYSTSVNAYVLLKKCILTDRTGMVRGYAIMSLGDIAQTLELREEAIAFLISRTQVETVVFTKICLTSTLYQLSEDGQYLTQLLGYLDTKKYQNRCATVNALKNILDERNREIIMSAIVSRNEIESTVAVKSSIKDFLADCATKTVACTRHGV